MVDIHSPLHRDKITLELADISDLSTLARELAYQEVCVFEAAVEMLGRIHANLGAYLDLA